MIVMAGIQKGFDPQEVESQIKAANQGLDARVQIMKNIGVVIIDYSDGTTLAEAKNRLGSCSAIKQDAICEDSEVHLIQ